MVFAESQYTEMLAVRVRMHRNKNKEMRYPFQKDSYCLLFQIFNTLWPKWNWQYFADWNLKGIVLDDNAWIPNKIPL